MVSPPTKMFSVAEHIPRASWSVPCHQMSEEEKTRAWFTDGFAHYVGTTQKWTAVAL